MKLKNVYPDNIINRGEGYTHNVNHCLKIGDVLYSEVEGTYTYKTEVNLKTLEGNCSCPYSWNCKHAVATYLVYKQGDFIDADKFLEYLKTLSKRELISIIEQSLCNSPDIALNYDLKTSTNYESFVNDFIDDFSYSRMNKAEKLASQFTFKQLLRMLNFLFKNEDNVFEIIYEDYYDDEEGEVLYYFESVLEKELMKKITNEKEMRQVLAVDLLHDEIINSAETLLKFKPVIKSVFSKDKFLSFLLHLENPDMTEVEESITESGRHELYHLPPKNIALAERIANHLQDKGLLFLVAVYKDDYKGIINNLSEFNILISEYYWLRRKLSDIVDLFIRYDFKDKKVTQDFLRKDLLRIYNSEQIMYLAGQINEYDFVKQKVDFKERFSQNKVLLERLFQLDEPETTILINEEEHIFENKHWTEIVEILNYLREKFGRQYIATIIKDNEDIFKTSSTLKSNLKKEGIFISHIRGVLNVEVKC